MFDPCDFQIMKSYWTVIQPRLARRTWKRFIWPIQLTGTFSSAQYVKCKPTIFRACIGILRLNIPLLVNIIVLIVVKSLPIVFTWGNTYLIVVILMSFLVNKLNAKWVLILRAQYVKCKPTIFRACIGILRLNIPLLVNIIVLIVVKSLPIVFTWGNTYLIVVILMSFLVNKLNAKWVLILRALFQWIILEGGTRNGNCSYFCFLNILTWKYRQITW